MTTCLLFQTKEKERESERVCVYYLCGVSPVCHMMWLVKCSLRVKALPHTSQRNGVSLAWLRTWFDRCSLRVNFLPQSEHACGVSPVCHITWFTKCSLRVNAFLQISQRFGVSPATATRVSLSSLRDHASAASHTYATINLLSFNRLEN